MTSTVRWSNKMEHSEVEHTRVEHSKEDQHDGVH